MCRHITSFYLKVIIKLFVIIICLNFVNNYKIINKRETKLELHPERRGLKDIFNNLLMPLQLPEVPKVTQLSQLLTQLFSINDKYIRNSTNHYKNNDKFFSNNNGLSFAEPIVLSDSSLSSIDENYQSSASAPEYGIYTNNMKFNNQNNYQNFRFNNNNYSNNDNNKELYSMQQFSSDGYSGMHSPIGTVYGKVYKNYYPSRPSIKDNPIITADDYTPPQNSIVVHYSKVEDSDPESGFRSSNDRPNTENHNSNLFINELSLNKKSNFQPTVNDNMNLYINMNNTSSELNAVHYIDDLHNKTHQEFNTISAKTNNFDNFSSTDTMRQTFGLSPDQKLKYISTNNTSFGSKIINNNNNYNDIQKNISNKYRNNGKSQELDDSSDKSKTIYSPKVTDANFTGMDWKPIVRPFHYGMVRPIEESMMTDMETPLFSENTNSISDHMIEETDISGESPPVIMAGHHMKLPSNNPYYRLIDSSNNLRMLPSSLSAKQIAPGVSIVTNSAPKPVVHRIRDFIKNILFPNRSEDKIF